MYMRCPKCGHDRLPQDQSLPAACPRCGVILAKVAQATARRPVRGRSADAGEAGVPTRPHRLLALLLHVPERVDAVHLWLRAALFAGLLVWGLRLIALDYRTGDMGGSFLHGPLLVFHEAGHVIFRPLGEWMGVFGGTLAQLLLPATMGVALLWQNRDPIGAAAGLWLLGVSLLDVAPYVYDALDPRLVLLSGATGEAGGHDWIYLLSSAGALAQAHRLGALTHALGAATIVVALAWAAVVLVRQQRRRAANAPQAR